MLHMPGGRAMLVALVCLGCEVASNLEPTEPLDHLDRAETAQLCRFTVDVLGGVVRSCAPTLGPSLTDFDRCADAPPWSLCEAPTAEVAADVGSWEDCVRALSAGDCDPEALARCWHLACAEPGG